MARHDLDGLTDRCSNGSALPGLFASVTGSRLHHSTTLQKSGKQVSLQSGISPSRTVRIRSIRPHSNASSAVMKRSRSIPRSKSS
ncbi:hypothetical protein GFL38_36295 [Rhizobium leguminosarum bv. viciae]|nr:hypothetical protein [Rhizobium leguminosarum bv. viciae]